MRVVKILWRILIGLVELFVAWAVFNAADTKFEAVVLSILVLVYADFLSKFSMIGRALDEATIHRNAQYLELAKLLEHPRVPELEESVKKASEGNAEVYGATWWINSTVVWLMSLYAIWRLVKALLFY
jgi:hypothetical protein